jgi:hypothetical protein
MTPTGRCTSGQWGLFVARHISFITQGECQDHGFSLSKIWRKACRQVIAKVHSLPFHHGKGEN